MANKPRMTKEQIEQEKINGWKRELERLKRRESIYRSRYGDNIPKDFIVDEKTFWEQKWSEDKKKTLDKERYESVKNRFTEFFRCEPRIIKCSRELDCQGVIWGYKDYDFHQDTIDNILNEYSFRKSRVYELCSSNDNNLPYFYIRLGKEGELVVAFQSNSDENYMKCVEFMAEIYKIYSCKTPQAMMLASKSYEYDTNYDAKYNYDGKFLISIRDNSKYGASSFVDYCRNRVIDNIALFDEEYIKLLSSTSTIYTEQILRYNLQKRIEENGTEQNISKLLFARNFCDSILGKETVEGM